MALRKNILTTSNPKSLNLVVLYNKKIIGFCDCGPSFDTSPDYKGEVYAIYLLNEYKYMGIGTELMRIVQNHLCKQKLTPFIIWVLAENKNACRFYQKFKGIIFQKKVERIGNTEHQEFGYLFCPSPVIRITIKKDITTLVSLSLIKRLNYEKALSQFWRYAGHQAEEAQEKWFEELLMRDDYIMLTAELNNTIVGFIIGKLMPAPEVYNPGGLTLMIDDFCVADGSDWQTVGAHLIDEIKMIAKTKGAVQIVVVSGVHDEAKRQFLTNQDLIIASEWYVGSIE